MNRFHNYLILVTLTALLLVAAGCQQEEVSSLEGASHGKIVLNLSPGEVFVDVETRATVTDITGYIFTLSGTDSEGAAVNKTISLTSEVENTFSSIIEAGTYTLTVENISQSTAEEGNGRVYYKGTSASFTLQPGQTVNLGTINMGAPKNAMVSLAVDNTFSALYENPQLTYGAATVKPDAPGYFMVPDGGTLTFSLSAKGKNHAQEIEGAFVSVAVEAGKHTTVTLTAQPINSDWVVIPVVSGTHNGEFDVKARKP
ncbi:MAG: DUF4493 domain-containing protein [Bacteroidaceae bacterium]|nr:DUF4493 domain-containing protein [Bacteroidaceae bacterium]